MKRAEILLSLAGVVSATAYLMGNPAVALVGAAVMAHYSMARAGFRPSVRVRREVPERGTEREPVKASLTVENLASMDGRVSIRETSGKVFARELTVEIGPLERKRLEQTLVPLSKGRVNLRAEAVFEDGLGLFRKTFPVEGRDEITVFPSPLGIREAMRERHQISALSETEKALGIGAETLEFEELREFLPGDDITRIDWKATSRLQEVVVRVFRRETLADVYVLINVDGKFRREMRTGKVDYLVLILAQLIAYFRRFGHAVRVVAYDDSGIVRFSHSSDPLAVLEELELKGEVGLPPLRPSRLAGESALGRIVRKIRSGSSNSGVLKAAMKPGTGSYVIIIDDLGLHPMEIVKAARVLARRGSQAVLLYPNPVLFIDRSSLDEKTLETAYKAYCERKMLARKVSGWIKVIEVGPKDLLPRVVKRL
ncbi:DUF58 domain-containing protein [Thermococcus camini]|uniref:DUF58 domain-containing protein n=1 Tax=Thermococcus camini TaxID=2016373 RepID=A0A7G2D5P6_9EURY|nr:DUF58 domain-containing protein [Thermococcus camini]CAD5243318.1 conserved exported protein of unknown function [Thermococcus camini]